MQWTERCSGPSKRSHSEIDFSVVKQDQMLGALGKGHLDFAVDAVRDNGNGVC